MKAMGAARLGNEMFLYASLVGIAARNKMVPILTAPSLESIFRVTATGHYVIKSPAINVIEESSNKYALHSLGGVLFAFLDDCLRPATEAIALRSGRASVRL